MISWFGTIKGNRWVDLKMANGTNSQGGSPFPGTRGKSSLLWSEQQYINCEYHAKVVAAKEDPEKLPRRDSAFGVARRSHAGYAGSCIIIPIAMMTSSLCWD
jgi:hypothetical protein